MYYQEKVAELIKEYSADITEAELQEELTEEFTEHIFDVSAEGLAYNFDSIEAEDVEDIKSYFEREFSFYSTKALYHTEQGFYYVYQT